MDKGTLLKSLSGTLDASIHNRKQAEEQLRFFEAQPGFTAYLLDLIIDGSVNLGVQVSAAIFFKNRVSNYWVVPDLKAPNPRYIQPAEKPSVKSKLIETLAKTYKNNQLRAQLSAAISIILNAEKWDELVLVMPKLISDTSDIDHVYTGLICLLEYTKTYRFSHDGSRNIILDEVAESMFPSLENLANNLYNDDSSVSDEMLYLILKIFKYSTFTSLPAYLEDATHLGTWCQIHIMILSKPLLQLVLLADPSERVLNPRVKAVKWAFANLHRLLFRHGGGVNTAKKDSPFAQAFLSNFVPEILNVYWPIIEKWSSQQIWLSEASVFHLISFLEQTIDTPAYPLIEDKMEAIVKHVLLPTLNATKETIELYEDEPEEYIRRFFDISRDNTTADSASVNFLFRLTNSKFAKTASMLLTIVNEVFQLRASDRNNLDYAIQTEGALRILETISFKLEKNSSPVKGQTDQLLYSLVYPELSDEVIAKTPWLTARACDTIAMFMHKYTNQQILQDIFQGIVRCFQQQDQFPIQITAVDAMRTLVEEDTVASQISQQAPQLMNILLNMSKNFESDILTTVMDVFVEKFAPNLEPYATELAVRLVEQFNRLAQEITEQTSGGGIDVDKEYLAAGILTTLTSLVIAMNASPQVSRSLELIIKDMVKFILENSMAQFLSEVVEMLESIVFNTEEMSSTMWELYQTVIDCFGTYAADFFDTFHPFLEGVVLSSFGNENITIENPNVQSLFNVSFQILTCDSVDPIFAHYAFELIEFALLKLQKKSASFLPTFIPEMLKVYQNLESQDAFDGYMLHYLSVVKVLFACMIVDAPTTLLILKQNDAANHFFEMWVKYSSDFQSVYGCKLQILAALALLLETPAELLPGQDLVGEAVDLLISNLEVLPHAVKARTEILNRENGVKAKTVTNGDEEELDEDYYEEDLEADEAELEAMKQTPIDDINVYPIFAERISQLQQQDPAKYEAIFGSLDDSQKEIANLVVQVYLQQK